MQALCEALIDHVGLKYFDISHNNIGDVGAVTVAKMLQGQIKRMWNSSGNAIVDLKMSNNKISSEGLILILNTLTPKMGKQKLSKQWLQSLDIQQNNINEGL